MIFWLTDFPWTLTVQIGSEWLVYKDLVRFDSVVHLERERVKVKDCLLKNQSCINRFDGYVSINESKWIFKRLVIMVKTEVSIFGDILCNPDVNGLRGPQLKSRWQEELFKE